MRINDAQQNHIEQSSIFEETTMKAFRPLAIVALRDLMQTMERDYDDWWLATTRQDWQLAVEYVSLAVSGRADGYFDTPYPPLSEMVKALFE